MTGDIETGAPLKILVLGLGAVQLPRAAFLLLDQLEKEEYSYCQGGKCLEYVDNHQADIKISFINLENNEKQGKILYFVVSPYTCFPRNAIDVL